MMRTLILLILCLPLAHALEWSEIMFDPAGTDDRQEYVELLGEENLTGCSIADSSSADQLQLLHWNASGIILIIETDSPLNATRTASVYGAGKAIGNGLGNAQETLTISCADVAFLTTSYDTASIEGWKSGLSIEWRGGWQPANATPGRKAPQETLPQPSIHSRENDRPCNSTLALTMSATRATVGESVQFTIVSADFSSWEAFADGDLFAYGDTLAQREHAVMVPQSSELKIVARATQCSGEQRAVRLVKVEAPAPTSAPEPIKEPEPVRQNSTTVHMSAPTPDHNPSQEIQRTPAPIATGAVIVDTDQDAIPWISAFGMVTLVVSVVLFYVERKHFAKKGPE